MSGPAGVHGIGVPRSCSISRYVKVAWLIPGERLPPAAAAGVAPPVPGLGHLTPADDVLKAIGQLLDEPDALSTDVAHGHRAVG